jgi:peptidoglycan/xylan/chitin deacetylase (PgdA/CDA1 family)
MRLYRPFIIARYLYPEAIFRMESTEKVLWLTFDDGPDPISTLPLLDILDSCSVKAIFFCSGKAAEMYPELVMSIRAGGHLVGNHGYSHPDGWRCKTADYSADVARSDELTSSTLFRPPFGRLKIEQYKQLKDKYRIVFWDLMPYDFDKSFGAGRALQVLKEKTRPGSVIVLHDSENSLALDVLEDFIVFAQDSGYIFSNILPNFTPKSPKGDLKNL